MWEVTPQLRTIRLSPSLQNGGAVFGKYCDGRRAVENNFAIIVTELANSEQVVMEGWHDFGIANWKVELDFGLG
jgi:hypothetical protein